MKKKKQEIYFEIMLHNVRSVQNVASIFRLADCIGASKIILSGITPSYIDRFGRMREDFTRVSLSSEKNIKWEKIGIEPQNQDLESEVEKENLKNTLKYIENFKKENGIVLALEQDKKSVNIKDFSKKINKKKKYLIIPGREVEGLEKEILKIVDHIVEINQYGKKESLNIFSALSVALYTLFDK